MIFNTWQLDLFGRWYTVIDPGTNMTCIERIQYDWDPMR